MGGMNIQFERYMPSNQTRHPYITSQVLYQWDNSIASTGNTPTVDAPTVNTPTVDAPTVNTPTINTPTVNTSTEKWGGGR